MLTKEQILDSNDIKAKMLNVPEWGGQVKIRMLTGAERDQLETITFPPSGQKTTRENIRATWCVFSIVDDDGKRLFDINDIDKLGTKSAAALDRIFTAALKLNKVSGKDIEEMAENFEQAQAEGSNSN